MTQVPVQPICRIQQQRSSVAQNIESGHNAQRSCETEGKLLGAILQSNSVLDKVADLKLEDFADSRHQAIFKLIQELVTTSKCADLESISQFASLRGLTEKVGGLAYLASLTDHALPPSAPVYARIVRDVAARRKLRLTAGLLSEACDLASNDDILRALDEVEQCRCSFQIEPDSIYKLEDVPKLSDFSHMSIAYVVEELIQAGAITLLTGEPGVGKSYLAERLCAEVALGRQFLGFKCHPTPILYLDAENPPGLVLHRLGLIAHVQPPNLHFWGGWVKDPPPKICDPRLLAIAKRSRPLIVFDSFLRFHKADENCASEMRSVMAGLRQLADAGASILLLHHKSKSEGSKYRGSSDILAAVDVAMALTTERTGVLALNCFKNRFGAEWSISIRPNFESGQFDVMDRSEGQRGKEAREKLIEVIQRSPGLSQNEVIRRAEIRRSTATELLAMGEGHHWHCKSGPRNSRRFYPLTSSHTKTP